MEVTEGSITDSLVQIMSRAMEGFSNKLVAQD